MESGAINFSHYCDGIILVMVPMSRLYVTLMDGGFIGWNYWLELCVCKRYR